MSEKWKKLIHEVFGENVKLIFPRFFDSKKNQVTLLQMEHGGKPLNIVAKYFVWGDIDREWETLTRAHSLGLRVPRPISRLEGISFMEFIPGKTLKAIADRETSCINPLILGSWLGEFHGIFKKDNGETLLKGDSMLPNFIIHQESGLLYGVDFEESHYGDPVDEAADIYATLLIAGTPREKPSFERARGFLEAYLDKNPLSIDGEVFREMLVKHIDKRKRFIPYREDEFDEYIRQVKSTESREWTGEGGYG
jgi:tRNA A-37 threonylcarbamoyl transferase component Bud32